MNALLLTFLLLSQNPWPQPVKATEGVTIQLPGDILESPKMKRRLFSGLTTTIELATTVKMERGDSVSFFCFLTLRYDVWEERLLVHLVNARKELHTNHFDGLEPLAVWLKDAPILIAFFEEDPGTMLIKTRCRIIPFSQQEAGQTQDWFARKLNVPAAGERGSTNPSKQRESTGETGGQGIFEVLLTTSINRNAVKTYRWKWRLPEGG